MKNIENSKSCRTLEMSDEGLNPTHPVSAYDEFGQKRDLNIAGEFPLTIRVDDQEIVTLMTLGTHPEKLTLGYLRNQRLIENIDEIKKINVNWDLERVNVTTHHGTGIDNLQEKTARKTVTTGCGQGTIFSCTLDRLYENAPKRIKIKQSSIYNLLDSLRNYNQIYRAAGAVHGCALCDTSGIIYFVEDVGRHNATDTISGEMWIRDISGEEKIFYTTGRLTSEIVMKTALMGISILISRSGITNMGLDLAEDLGVTLIARAKGAHFLVYNGEDTVIFDRPPPERIKTNT